MPHSDELFDEVEDRRCRGIVSWRYFTPSRKLCCPANSIFADDLASWFSVRAAVVEVTDDSAQLSLQISFQDVAQNGSMTWKPLRWSDLGEMHGRRLHASIVSTDLRFAWHLHPLAEETIAANADLLTLQLRLPAHAADEAPLQVRVLLNFGVRADARGVDLCVSEDSVHVDGGDGREMLVEGQATSELLTLRPGDGHAEPVRDFSGSRTVAPLPLGGRGSDEVLDGAAVTRDLETGCGGGDGATAAACWLVQLRAGLLDAAAYDVFQRRLAAFDQALGTTLFEVGGRFGNGDDGGELAVVEGNGAGKRTCVGLNVLVQHPDGTPAAGALSSYLTMGAHAVVASANAHRLWHVHLSVPSTFARAKRADVASCAVAMPGMGGAEMAAPHTPFGPSLIGAWIAEQPGLYALYIMAKTTNATAAADGHMGPAGLVAPTYFVRIGPLPVSEASGASTGTIVAEAASAAAVLLLLGLGWLRRRHLRLRRLAGCKYHKRLDAAPPAAPQGGTQIELDSALDLPGVIT